MGGRERKQWWPEQCGRGGAAIAGGEEHAGVIGTGATGHGSKNRGHREMAGVHAISAVPRRRSEDAVGAVTAMAGGKELHGALV